MAVWCLGSCFTLIASITDVGPTLSPQDAAATASHILSQVMDLHPTQISVKDPRCLCSQSSPNVHSVTGKPIPTSLGKLYGEGSCPHAGPETSGHVVLYGLKDVEHIPGSCPSGRRQLVMSSDVALVPWGKGQNPPG